MGSLLLCGEAFAHRIPVLPLLFLGYFWISLFFVLARALASLSVFITLFSKDLEGSVGMKILVLGCFSLVFGQKNKEGMTGIVSSSRLPHADSMLLSLRKAAKSRAQGWLPCRQLQHEPC